MNGRKWYGKQLVVVAWALLFAGGLAGCLGGGDEIGDEHDAQGADLVEDPLVGLVIEHEEGTAHEFNTEYLASEADRCLALGTTLGEVCQETLSPALNEVPEAGGVPAPHLDVLEVTLSETSTDLIVTMEISELDEDWSRVQEGTIVNYHVEWERDGMDEGPLFAVRNWDGDVHLSSKFYTVSPECNDYWICEGPTTFEIEYGSPGVIEMTVPRATMLDGEEGTQFNNTSFGTWVTYGRYAFMGWQVESDADTQMGRFGAWTAGMVDEGGGADEDRFTFTTPLAPFDREELTVRHLEHEDGNTYDISGDYRSDIDILAIGIKESDETITVYTQLASVEETPNDHGLDWSLGMPSGRVHNVGIYAEDGKRSTYAGYNDVSQGTLRWVDHPVETTVVTGTPGWVNLTMKRSDLGSPKAGERLGLVWVSSNSQASVWSDESAGPARVWGGFYLGDRLTAGNSLSIEPYWLLDDTAAKTMETHGIQFEDDVGDVRLPDRALLHQDKAAQYDITYVEVTGHDEDTVRASIGIDDLSQMTIPTGYEAIVYAIGLETQQGQFMAFFIKDNNQQSYYCAPDTLTFPGSPTDPRGTVLTPTTGMQSAPRVDGPASGAITIHIPHSECLGLEEGEPFQVSDIAVGTFLLEDPAGLEQLAEVHTVDTARANPEELPVLLGVEPIPDNENLKAAWYTAPLGLNGQDWDIMGIVVALLLATGGAYIVYLRRRKLRNYLNRVSHTAKIKDLTARETGLGELREALRADLVAGKIAESHYTIVLRHIEDAMKHVRVKSIEETFRELPFHIVSKLRAVLNDGVITQDEREMVVDLVERAEIPAKYKQRVMSRLDRWRLVDEVAKA